MSKVTQVVIGGVRLLLFFICSLKKKSYYMTCFTNGMLIPCTSTRMYVAESTLGVRSAVTDGER